MTALPVHRIRTTAAQVLMVENGRASGSRSGRAATGALAALRRLGLRVERRTTESLEDLHEVLQGAGSRRIVLVGGDGSVHAAANAPLARVPELGLVPAGRANNIARALGIPFDPEAAATLAVRGAPAPLDALRVETPATSLVAVEGLSAGFQARARSGYEQEDSGHLARGALLLAGALASYEPDDMTIRVDGRLIHAGPVGQLFVSNLPYFGFGFLVSPAADPSDGRLDATVVVAGSRRRLARRLIEAHEGRHRGRPGVLSATGVEALLERAVPLVADSTPLGVQQASVRVLPGHLRIATGSGAR